MKQSEYIKNSVTDNSKSLIYKIGEIEYRLNELLDKETNTGVNMLVEEKQCILQIKQLFGSLCEQINPEITPEYCEDVYLES